MPARRETPLEMADRFEMGRARRGMLAGLQPLIDGALGIAGGGQMMGEQFGLALDEIGEMLFPIAAATRACNSCRRRAQQRAVGSVLHQRVLEQVGGMRSGAAAKQQSRIAELTQRGLQFSLSDAAPPARSVHRKTRGRAPRRSARPPWAPARAGRSRAISEACKVAGTDSAASDVAAEHRGDPVCSAPALSSTALVNSSTNSGTPSVRSTISATISAVSAALPASFAPAPRRRVRRAD